MQPTYPPIPSEMDLTELEREIYNDLNYFFAIIIE